MSSRDSRDVVLAMISTVRSICSVWATAIDTTGRVITGPLVRAIFLATVHAFRLVYILGVLVAKKIASSSRQLVIRCPSDQQRMHW